MTQLNIIITYISVSENYLITIKTKKLPKINKKKTVFFFFKFFTATNASVHFPTLTDTARIYLDCRALLPML